MLIISVRRLTIKVTRHLADRWSKYYDELVTACKTRNRAASAAGDEEVAKFLSSEEDCDVGGLESSTVVDNHIIDLSSPAIPQSHLDIAKLIVNKFLSSGYGLYQQTAALSIAILSSSLDQTIKSIPLEHSVGLFQLNEDGAIASGYDDAQLSVADTNIYLMLKYIKSKRDQDAAFAASKSLDEATAIFVRALESPHDVPEVTLRAITLGRQILR